MTEANKYAAELRDRSGRVTDARPLVRFLYDLLRDHLPAGELEKFVSSNADDITVVHYSNGWLAAYCQDLADRLTQVNLTVTAEDIRNSYKSQLISMIEKRVWAAYDKFRNAELSAESCPDAYALHLSDELGTFSSVEFGNNVSYRPWRIYLSLQDVGPPGYSFWMLAYYIKSRSANFVPNSMQTRLDDVSGAYRFELDELSHGTLFSLLTSMEQM